MFARLYDIVCTYLYVDAYIIYKHIGISVHNCRNQLLEKMPDKEVDIIEHVVRTLTGRNLRKIVSSQVYF
jgi:hypothetical protein